MPLWIAERVTSSCTYGPDCTQSYIYLRTAEGNVRCNYGDTVIKTETDVIVEQGTK